MASDARSDPAAELLARLGETPIKATEICSFLDRLTPAERVKAIRAVGRGAQRRLYEAVDGFGELRLVDMVGPDVPDLTSVRHYGRNTLPAFSHFEKRFCRPAGRDPQRPGELWGFNFQTMSFFTGPGYFLAREDPERREVLVDYNSVPSQAPPGWPPVRSNEGLPARFVYGFMIDTLRRVSEHVSIGSAARKGRDMGSWFLLCREA